METWHDGLSGPSSYSNRRLRAIGMEYANYRMDRDDLQRSSYAIYISAANTSFICIIDKKYGVYSQSHNGSYG